MRRSGFTLIELLIVIMIIAILSGMTLLAAMASVEGAEAAKVLNDLRNVKAAVTYFKIDESYWPTGTLDVTSLERYMDGRSANFMKTKYDGVYVVQNAATERLYVGLGLKDRSAADGVRKKLAINSLNSSLFEDENETAYSGAGYTVYINLK